jgi:hypothetical protein
MVDESVLQRIARKVIPSSPERGEAHPVSGGCALLPRSLCSQLPFSFLYNEDWLLFLEAERMGYESVSLTPALFNHRSSAALEDVSYVRLRREAMGEIAFRTLRRLSGELWTLQSLADEALLTEERIRYATQVRTIRQYCQGTGLYAIEAHLGALEAWLEVHENVYTTLTAIGRNWLQLRYRWNSGLARWHNGLGPLSSRAAGPDFGGL